MGTYDLAKLISDASLRAKRAANPAEIAQVASRFNVTFPDEFVELWNFSDGLDGDEITFIPLSTVVRYAEVFESGFGLIPFTDCNDSNPYSFFCRGPLRGTIVHVFHDDEPRLVCHGLKRFLELICDARRNGDDVSLITGDFDVDRPERTPEDVVLAQNLVQLAVTADRNDPSRQDALLFAAQLFGPGQEDELGRLMNLGDEYTRDAVLRRLKGLGTKEAADWIRRDQAEFESFLSDFKRGCEAAGFQIEPMRHGTFRLQPGRINPNLAMLFADRHRSGSMNEWINRFKERVSE
jgi:hypothetical protein